MGLVRVLRLQTNISLAYILLSTYSPPNWRTIYFLLQPDFRVLAIRPLARLDRLGRAFLGMKGALEHFDRERMVCLSKSGLRLWMKERRGWKKNPGVEK